MATEVTQAEQTNMLDSQAAAIADAEAAGTSAVVAKLREAEALTKALPIASSVFGMPDTTTQGTWQGKYDPATMRIACVSTAIPAGGTAHPWKNPTSDIRGLQTDSGRIASCWYSATSFYVDLTGAGAFYLLDWDRVGRVMRVEALDSSGAVRETITGANFGEGVWLPVSAAGRYRFVCVQGYNAVLSAVSGPATTTTPPPTGGYDPNAYITVHNAAEATAKRNALANKVWGGAAPPVITPMLVGGTNPADGSAPPPTGWKTCETWRNSFNYYDANGTQHWLDTAAYCLRPSAASINRAALLMPGHSDNLWNRDYNTLATALLSKGVTVIACGMVCFEGMNVWRNGEYPDHDSMFVGSVHAPKLALPYAGMINHYWIAMNQCKKEGFAKVGAIGHSGGGWAINLLGALDTRIAVCYNNSGSQPEGCWPLTPAISGGDKEQVMLPRDLCSYEDLYVLCRGSVQGCCSNDPYYPGTKHTLYQPACDAAAKSIGNSGFRAIAYTAPVVGDAAHTLGPAVRDAFVTDMLA